ncbi:MAG: putative motility protein [Chloroflexi bacterium]|nr:putative motility protein [Chloroflexota bacterium]
MNITGISPVASSDLASRLGAGTASSEVSMAMLKRTLDQQKQGAAALIKMIEQTPKPSPSGRNRVDMYA